MSSSSSKSLKWSWENTFGMDHKHVLYVYALGFCVMNGKQAAIWQSGFLFYGVWAFFTATVACAFFYLCLSYCLAELVSIVPFSGGCYGYVRCTLGPTLGFLTGCSEAAKYTLFNMMTAYTVGVLFQNSFAIEDDWLPVIWLGCYLFGILLKIIPLSYSVYIWAVLMVSTMVTQGIFIFGSIKSSNWQHFRKDLNPYDTKHDDILQALSSAGYFFFGIDSVRTCMDNESNKVVPQLMVTITYISILTALASIIAMRAYAMNPLLFGTDFFPYQPGLVKVLSNVNPKWVNLLNFPCIMGATLGFFYSGGKQVSSMIESGLFPSFPIWKKNGGWLTLPLTSSSMKYPTIGSSTSISSSVSGKVSGHRVIRSVIVMQGGGIITTTAPPPPTATMDSLPEEENNTFNMKYLYETILPLSLCGILSYTLLVIFYYKVNNFLSHIIRIGISLASVEGFLMMGAYIIFSTRFATMERGLKSPFGIIGAILAMIYWGYLFVANSYYQDPNDRLWEGMSVLFFYVLCMTYYIVIASRKQFYSQEEQEKFLKAYVVNANREKKKGGKGRKESINAQKVLAGLQVSISTSTSSGRLMSFHGNNRQCSNSIQGSISPSPTNHIINH